MSAARPVFFIVSRGEIPEAALPALRMALLPIGIAARDGGLEATVGEAGLRQADARRAVLAAQWLRDAAVRAGAAPAVGVAFGGRAEAETLAASPGEVRASAPVESATRGEFGWLADGTAWRLGPGGAPALLDLRRRPPGPPADPAALAAILEAAAAGRSSWVEGDARSGKSALLDALESALPAPGGLTPAAAALAATRPRLPRASGHRTGLEEQGALAALARLETDDPSFRPGGADWDAVFGPRGAGVRLRAIDDAHLLDGPTRDTVARLARAGSPWVLAARPGATPPQGFLPLRLAAPPAAAAAPLDSRVREALAEAAVLGPVFWGDVLAEASGRVAGSALDDAWRARLLDRHEGSLFADDLEWTFRDETLRLDLAGSVPEPRARALRDAARAALDRRP